VPGATQAVLGEGPDHAEIVFVGEQPGDQEDLQGRPSWVPRASSSPALWRGRIDRAQAYLTNA
jgi:DNA polymerase